MRKTILLFFSAVYLLTFGVAAHAQSGDKKGVTMPEVWRDMDVPQAPALSPGEALKSFKLQPGYEISIVAAEPLVVDPVAMAIDPDGRLWVVEMRGFMPNVDGTGEDVRNGVIAVLEDIDGDGRMDKRTEFLNGLQMPRAIAHVKGGVLVGEPPNLWFCQDTDGDLRCDKKVVIVDNYGRQGPVEHTDNGLMRGMDNWLYNAKSTKRLRFVGGEWMLEKDIFRGQWGITQDDFGRLYYNNNSNPIYVDLVPGNYLVRNPNFTTKAGVNRPGYGSREVWTGRVNPGINRGYQTNMLRDGHLATFTGVSGPVIYRGDAYPKDALGDAFVPEPSGNMIRRQKISFKDGSVTGENAYEKSEWLTSTDERFRPVNLYNTPEGDLMIVDMYRGILQHRVYVTSFLRKQILERGLDKPVGLGRIYRVTHQSKRTRARPGFAKKSGEQLAAMLENPGGWQRDTAQRLLIDAGDKSIAPALRKLAAESEFPATRMHALWTLEGLGALDTGTIEKALADKRSKVRETGIRLAEVLINEAIADEEEQMARAGLLDSIDFMIEANTEIGVLRQIALSVSGIRRAAADVILRRLAVEFGEDEIVRDGIISGLGNRELEFLQRALADSTFADESKPVKTLIRELAGCVARQKNAYRIDQLLRLAAAQEETARWRLKSILDGLADVAAPGKKGRKAKPVHYAQQPVAYAALAKISDKQTREKLAKLDKFITWGAVAAPPPPPRPLTDSEKKLFATGKELYLGICASCHQPNGLGEEGKAPPLLDSPFLLGNPKRGVGIVLHGITGPIEVHGRIYDMTMPGIQGFQDEHIAAILTYVRREWEHAADPVTPADVAAARKTFGAREAPWTAKELLKLN
jgi:mono/diheme cytochrome c family protein/glucose/arabinose dehydrogenase